MKKFIVVLLTVYLCAGNAYAYGFRGHALVGAIADQRLKKKPAVAAEVAKLLDGLTLEQVANLPDSVKNWDDCNPKYPPKPAPITDKKRINKELRAFHKANLCSKKPSHHEFHYTDVPVLGHEEYEGPDKPGRSEFDVVQMIPFCIRVLKGEEPETNDRAITKSVAVILLAHYLGDIHQPLHVGAQFFDASGNPFQPTATNHGFEDQGGNKLTLYTFWKGELTQAGKSFHSYWDGQTVENAFGTMQDATVATNLAKKAPKNWKLNGGVETWAEQLANDILPLAQEAHERLAYSQIKTKQGARDIISGRAEEKEKKPGEKFYAVWAAAVVKDEIHKGGWRLAALLEEIL